MDFMLFILPFLAKLETLTNETDSGKEEEEEAGEEESKISLLMTKGGYNIYDAIN